MKPARDPLLLPVAFFAAGIFIWNWLQPAPAHLLAGMAALLPLWWLARKSRVVSVAAAAVFLVGGALTAEKHRRGSAPELDAEPGETLLLAGCVVEPVVTSGDAVRFVVELEPGARVRITFSGTGLPRVQYGQNVEVQARVRKPRNFGNPGAFDYTTWLARQEIFWLASARGAESARILPGKCGSPVTHAAMQVREAVLNRIQSLYPESSYERQVLPALLVGATGMNDKDWTEGYRRTGTYHALVVSGLHIAVVAGTALAILRFTGLPLGLVLCVAASIAWTYAAVVDWQPPALRSAAGFTLFLIARWFFRRGSVLNLLAAVLLVILAVDPESLYDASLQLTALSVAAIGGVAAPLTDRMIRPYAAVLRRLHDSRPASIEPASQFRVEMRLLAKTAALCTRTSLRVWAAVLSGTGQLMFWVAEAALLSACVQLALTVPLVLYFHTFSATAIGANVAVAPLLSLAVPVGLLACLTALPPLVAATSGLLGLARVGTEVFLRFEPGWRVPDPPLWVAVASLAGVAVLAWVARLRAAGSAPAWVLSASAMTAIGIAAVVWIAPFDPDVEPGSLELTLIDVGQGDSLLVVTPQGRTLLVDAGGFPTYGAARKPALDPGEDVVSPYLWHRGIKHLDAVAISHLHEDHAGGMPAIIRNFRPAEVWVGAGPEADLRALGRPVRQLRAGDRPWPGIEVVAPAADYKPADKPHNRDSLVLLLKHGRHSFLLTGDTDDDVDATEIDVLKVAHHGSRYGTTAAFLDRALPLFAAISAGADNSYGHPHPDLLGRLRQTGARVLRTDKDGLISFRSNGRRLSVNRP